MNASTFVANSSKISRDFLVNLITQQYICNLQSLVNFVRNLFIVRR